MTSTVATTVLIRYRQTLPQLCVLSQKLINAWEKLKLLFSGEILVFIEEKLELVL